MKTNTARKPQAMHKPARRLAAYRQQIEKRASTIQSKGAIAATDRAIAALQAERKVAKQYRRVWAKAHTDKLSNTNDTLRRLFAIAKDKKGRAFYRDQLDKVEAELERRYGTSKLHGAWGAAGRQARLCFRAAFARPSRSLGDLQLKVGLWNRLRAEIAHIASTDEIYWLEDATAFLMERLARDITKITGEKC